MVHKVTAHVEKKIQTKNLSLIPLAILCEILNILVKLLSLKGNPSSLPLSLPQVGQLPEIQEY